jgi:ABC-type Zn uptake system ZnuABC Zn-binding protein ZnuA
MKRLLLLLLVLLSLATMTTAQVQALEVVATTTILADVARSVGGDGVSVTALIPPDADGHAWQPTPEDVLRVARAKLVLVVGAGYETFLGTLIENAAQTPVVVVSNGIEMLPFGEHADPVDGAVHDETIGILGDEGVCEPGHDEAAETTPEADPAEEHEHESCDPHVWTSPKNVMVWARNMADAFSAADSVNAAIYQANADAYIAQLEALDTEVCDILAVVPEERRVLVTNHEFLGYFAHEYGFEVVGVIVPGGTTLGENDPQQVADLIAVIRQANVPAIFAEKSAAAGLAETVAQEAGVGVVTTLYSESLSGADGPAATYLDYLLFNAQTIADALTGS